MINKHLKTIKFPQVKIDNINGTYFYLKADNGVSLAYLVNITITHNPVSYLKEIIDLKIAVCKKDFKLSRYKQPKCKHK